MPLAAGIDLAFARDSSSLVICSETLGQIALVDMLEVRGGDASDPRLVVGAFAATLAKHGIRRVMADCHYRKLLQVTLAEAEIELLPEPAGAHGNTAVYLYARRVLTERRLTVPEHPLRQRLAAQLRDTRGKPMSGGAMQIEHGRKDGGHGDLVSALVLALWQLREAVDVSPEGIRAGTAELFESAGTGRTWHRDGDPLVVERGGDDGGRWDGYAGNRWG